jgi:thiamine biosynthesis lipoprotein
MTSVRLTVLILGLACGRAAAAEPALERFTYIEPHMGTRFKVVLYAANEATAKAAARAAFERVAVLDAIMSDYRPASELMQLCRKAGDDPVPVSADLFAVLDQAQALARRSDGAFDVTIGPVVRLWRLARRTQRLPEKDELAAARALVGFEKMKLDPKARTVQLLKPGMLLDLGGIAKGYAAEAALAVLKKHGLPRALVAAGGDVVVGDPPPDAAGWKVGIAPLEHPSQAPSRFLLLTNAAVSTSGDAEQFVVIDGQRYSHIVDPRAGLGLLGRMSVTVVAPSGTASDSLATAVSILGEKAGLALIEDTPGIAALIVRQTEQGEQTLSSKRFKNFATNP